MLEVPGEAGANGSTPVHRITSDMSQLLQHGSLVPIGGILGRLRNGDAYWGDRLFTTRECAETYNYIVALMDNYNATNDPH